MARFLISFRVPHNFNLQEQIEKDSSSLTHDPVLARRIEEHAEAWAAPFLVRHDRFNH